jgi:hypothetical protein
VLTKRIEVYREMPSGELTLKIVWRGGEVTEHVIAKGRGGWTRRDEEILCKMVNHGRSQIEIAREFPTRKWSSIRDKASRLGIGSMLNMSIKPILDDKTYNDYLARQHKPYKAQSGMAWSEEEIALLAKLVDADEPAFEIYKAIPYRTRDAIRKKGDIKIRSRKGSQREAFPKTIRNIQSIRGENVQDCCCCVACQSTSSGVISSRCDIVTPKLRAIL